MPWLSWNDGPILIRHRMAGDMRLGRDASQCGLVAPPGLETVSRVHALIAEQRGDWWIKDLSSQGSSLNGLPLGSDGSPLKPGDELDLAGWIVRFTEGFPGLDGEVFAERVGELAEEIRPDPTQTLLLLRGLELLYRGTERLLRETESDQLIKGLVEEAMHLLLADRAFLVMFLPDGTRRLAHSVGDVNEAVGLSRSVLDYVAQERVAVLSNSPLADPRFESMSLLEMHRGGLMCAPLSLDDQLQGFLYLDREEERRPFTRFDLALFQTFVRQGVLAMRHTFLSRRALGQAEIQGELLRLRGTHQREREERAQLMLAMERPLHWVQAFTRDLNLEGAQAMRQQLQRMGELIEHGLGLGELAASPAAGHPWKVDALQDDLGDRWNDLLRVAGVTVAWPTPPPGSIWVGGGPVSPALGGLVEPLLLQLPAGSEFRPNWEVERGYVVLRMGFPAAVKAPLPDPWTRRILNEAGLRWRWADQTLYLQFPEGPDSLPEEPLRPLLGLVTEELGLLGLFQSAAEAGELGLFPLEELPPVPPLPRFRMLVVDVQGVKDPAACIRAYRQHPSFTTTPILAVRTREDLSADLIQAGATDWLNEGFRWEALHHRLQVLRGHQALQEKALEAGRLDTFRQMAGTL
ncbi:MAG TPA: GAF domain-containing protein, partial [Holophagaceae bacterium]|nr:GAF domain-containing protein [Holophagaceae bacterium]